jgi:2-iminobutanoate/2-iminopropanoate deaminase
MAKQVIKTDSAPAPVGPYSQALSLGNMVFCSGQVPLDPNTSKVVEGGVQEQTKQVMENIKAVLGAADLNLGNVVKTTIFLEDMGDFAAVNEVYSQYFSEPYPARSCVAVKTLPLQVKVEIEVLATRD